MPQDWLALLTLVFVLGMKHGFDADHLASSGTGRWCC